MVNKVQTSFQDETELKYVSPDLLDFDHTNPRFGGLMDKRGQPEIHQALLQEPYYALELVDSLLKNGFIDYEPLVVKQNGERYIVIEGNTDASRKGVVPADLVRQLSYDRADSVRKSILSKYKFDPNKFKVIGNGWDNPVANSTDPSNPDHNKRNRRVEVKVFPLEKE